MNELHQMASALYNQPACALIILALNILGVMLQQSPLWPAKWNGLVPWVLVVLGVWATVNLVPEDVFPKSQRNPKQLLGIIGFLFGFISFLLHDYPVQWATSWLANKFPGLPITTKPQEKPMENIGKP